MIITILKLVQKTLKYIIINVDKIGPYVLIIQVLYWFRGNIASFFSFLSLFRDALVYLNRIPLFRFFKKVIRILSIASLLLNLVILALFTEINVYNWIPSVPAVSEGLNVLYEASPTSTQDFVSWIVLKIKTFILWIWNGLLDFLKRIVKLLMGELDKYPADKPAPIDIEKEKYGDFYNNQYLQWLCNKLDEYKYYIIVSSVIFIGGYIIILYWDSISSCWRRRPGQDDSPDSEFPPYIPIPQPERSIPIPSISSDSSNSVSEYFRLSILDRLKKFKDKTRNFFKLKRPPVLVDIPKGIYSENGRDMYNGLPLPRVEILENGTEYYFNKSPDGFIRSITNKFENSGIVEIINPYTNKAISSNDISINERISLINVARNNAIYTAPENSFARNPIFEFTNLDLSNPNFSSTSAASSSSLPHLDDCFEEIPLDNKSISEQIIRNLLGKGKNKETSIPEDISPEADAFSSGSTTPTQSPKLPDFSDFID